MSDENAPASVSWWQSLIKWTVIIYGGGAVLTFLVGVAVFGGALTSISQVLGLATFYAAFWPFFIVLFFR